MLNPASSGGVAAALATTVVLASILMPFWGGGENPALERGGDAPWLSGMGGANHAYAQTDAAPFVTTWQTHGANQEVTIPVGGAAGTFTVDWGDGTIEQDVTGDQTHRYVAAGTYTVTISGDFTRIHLGSSSPPNTERLKSIDQWGDVRWTSMAGAFARAFDVVDRAADAPDLSRVTDMSGMFWLADLFNGDISGWDVSQVRDMNRMFEAAHAFNRDISDWDVSQVTDMRAMFRSANAFNKDLSGWDVTSVTDMSGMFQSADRFNGDLSGWDVSQVRDMHHMFSFAERFNGDVSGWDVSSVRSVKMMFQEANAFNGDVSGWDVTSVTDMSGMFWGADAFNGDISGWDVLQVRDMNGMFLGADAFNQDISGWDVSQVRDMRDMFDGADSFNQNLGRWYIVLDDASIDIGEAPGVVGSVRAQNSYLDGQDPVYGIGAGGDSDAFEMDGSDLVMKVTPAKDSYTVTVTSAGGFGSGNSRTLEVSVDQPPNSPPSVEAGPDKTVQEGETVELAGSGSDPEGGQLTHLWSHDSQMDVRFADPASPATTVVAPRVDVDTAITLTLTATDAGALSASDSMVLTVLDVPDDTTGPAPALSAPALTNASSVSVAVDFGEPINATTFDVDDVSVSGGGEASEIVQEGAAGQRFAVTVGAPDDDGEVVVVIPAGRVADLAGNTNIASAQMSVTFDRTAPVITIHEDTTITVHAGDTYADPGAACTDGLDGDLTGSVAVISDVDTAVPGTYQVTYVCTDGAGNSIEVARMVEVLDRPAPTGSGDQGWTVEEIVRMLGSKGEHKFATVARCEEGTTLTGATVRLHLVGLLGQIGTNPIGRPVSTVQIDIDLDASWLAHRGYWDLAGIIIDTSNSEISHAAHEYGITLDEYMDAGPDEVFEYPSGNVTRSYLGGLDAYETNLVWSGEGSCTVGWVRD